MSLYTLSEFMTLIKEDIGIANIPLPVTDEEFVNRFGNSALKEFSVRCPKKEIVTLTDEERLPQPATAVGPRRPAKYQIPKFVYGDNSIVGVYHFDLTRPMGFGDMFTPFGVFATPDSVIDTLTDMHMAASVGSAMSRAMTTRFVKPDIIEVYDGWAGGYYEAEVGITHDISLVTVPDTAFTQLRELAKYDMEEYLYNKLKRIDSLDIGIGNIQLKLDSWENAADNKKTLLADWDEECELDNEAIQFF